jgi:hypothetical protein
MRHDLALEMLVDATSTAWLVTGGALLLLVACGLFELWWWRRKK